MTSERAAGKARLLYVDDERPNLVAFRALLRDTYEVLIAENADEAFRLLESRDIPLIVSDQRMPGMSGTEFLEKVAKRFPATVRMILTGYSDIDAVVSAINRSQIYYYFKKPWNEAEVRLTLANALESVMTRRRLIESERRFRGTFEQAGLGIAHLELGGKVLRANRQLREFLGVVEAELVGEPLGRWLAEFDPAELLALAAGQGASLVRETSVPTPTGERWSRLTASVSFDGQGNPDYLIALVDDLTERRRSEQQLLKLSHAVEQSPVSIVITDREGRIEFVNPAFSRVSGYQADEVIGKALSLMRSGNTPEAVYRNLWRSIGSGSVWEGTLQNRRKNGEVFWERVTISPIRAPGGDISHYLAIKEDVTERNRLEEQLRQAQKMEAVGRLAGGVAHDFNNILTVIVGYGHLLKMGKTLDPEQSEKVDQIVQAAQRAAKLTTGLLAFSRKQPLDLRCQNLNDIVQHVQKFLVRVVGEDIRLKTSFMHDPIGVYVDGAQIEQVLVNLAANARDAMPSGGVLTIETERRMLDESFLQAHGYGVPGPYAVIMVSDNGTGMDHATRDRIFEPFFTTKEAGKGTGLGMAIVYGIVKHHSGFINVYSEPGMGTVFRIYIPLLEAEQEREEEPLPLSEPRGRAETILVAEDEQEVRALVEKILTLYGYRVMLVENGQECVDTFSAHRDGIDLVLMDLVMPKKCGREASDEIRKIKPGVRVLYTSGYSADFIRDHGVGNGDMEIIPKPVQPLDLLRKVREILDRKP